MNTILELDFEYEYEWNLEIYSMNFDGSEQTRLTNNPTEDSYPNYSPDGKELKQLTNNVYDDGAPSRSPF